MNSQKSILIIDDHPLFREGLKSIISRNPSLMILGESGTAAEGLRMVKEYQPDLAIIDISLPDKNGIILTRELRTLTQKTQILIISMHAGIHYIVEAFQAGARGYVTKESAHDRLLQGIEAVLEGEYFLDSSVSHEVVKALVDQPIREARTRDQAYGRLTAREQEIMRLLAEGFKSREIAEMLCISPKTVENHRANIMQKLELHSTLELVRYAARLGLIDVDLWKS